MNKKQINKEIDEVYSAIKAEIESRTENYCQSWWLTSKWGGRLKNKYSTPKLNRRAKVLVKEGYLSINKKDTSTSKGTSYLLTNKTYKRKSAMLK